MSRKKQNKKRLRSFIIAVFIIFELIVFFGGYMTGAYRTKKAFEKTELQSNVLSQSKNEKDSEKEVKEAEKTKEPSRENVVENEETTEKSVDAVIKDMSISDMIYQMMFVTPESITNMGQVIAAGETTKNALSNYPVGGIIYFGQNFESREQTINMIKNTQSFSKIPLFIGVDEEGGRVARLGSNPALGVTVHPPMRKIGDGGDLQKAYQIGETLGKELSELGFNVDFAPDADVLINGDNQEIGDRSFGTDPKLVADMVKSITEGLQARGVSATLKHFPGHGSTYIDSHTGRSESMRTLDELQNAEFLPFKEALNADFIMISHMTLVNATKEKVPSTLSKEVITDMLKGELGYEGIVITDSFAMGAITEEYSAGEAAVKAVEAGVDMILMSSDLTAAHNAISEAVKNGSLSRERLESSVRKILSLKYAKGMFN